MDSLEKLHLRRTNIEIILASVGRFCTNLVSSDISYCEKLKRIEGNFDRLKGLKEFDLDGCEHLLGHLDSSTSFTKFPQFPRFSTKLNLGICNLGDGNIPSSICELLNLQVLDLSGNKFSRLHFSISRITSLKFLNLSFCKSLVELPDLPSGLAILYANFCDSLETIGDLSKYKHLWKVSLWRRNKLVDSERIQYSMLQVNAVEDRLMSIILPGDRLISNSNTKSITLQLPHNLYTDFSGFLLSTHFNERSLLYGGSLVHATRLFSIVIKQEMSMDSQPNYDHWEELDKNEESYKYTHVGYVPFTSFRHIQWWNSADTKKLTFEIDGSDDFKVGLVRRKGKLGEIYLEECWDEEHENWKTFKIIYDLDFPNIKIEWRHF